MDEMVKPVGYLAKYVPFLDYLIEKNHKFKEKYDKMRQWIKADKKFTSDFNDKIERSIIVAYKELSSTQEFPRKLHKLFTVNLCSDDEDAVQRITTKTSDVRIISEDEDDVQLVATVPIPKPKPMPTKNQNASTNHIMLKKNQNQINNEILNRISKVVTVVVNDEQEPITLSPPSPPPPRTISVESTSTKRNSLPVDENNTPIFFRRGDLSVERNERSTSKSSTSVIEIDKEYSTSSHHRKKEKKKKHKKEKRHKDKSSKKKKHKDTVVELSSDSDDDNTSTTTINTENETESPAKSSTSIVAAPKPKEKTAEPPEAKKTNNNFDNSKLYQLEEELIQKSVPELEDLKKKLLNEVFPQLRDNFLNSDETVEVFKEIASTTPTTTPPIQIPTYELGTNNDLIPENQVQSNISDINNGSSNWPTQPTHNATSSIQVLQNSIPQPVPPPVLPTPLPTAVTSPILTTLLSSPSSSSTSLPVAASNRDPRLKKLLTQGQYVQNKITTPPIMNHLPQNLHNIPMVPPNGLPSSSSSPSIGQWPLQSNSPYASNGSPLNYSTSPMVQIPWYDAQQQQQQPTTSSKRYTKSNQTYGEHRQQLEKERLFKEKLEQMAKLREENERLKKEKAEDERLRKEKEEQQAKVLEAIEAEKSTEVIREILNKHQHEIVEKFAKPDERKIKTKKSSPIKQNSTSRIFKELECTVKGFDTIQDFVPKTIDGRRRCSISARKAIAENLGIFEPTSSSSSSSTSSTVSHPQKRLSTDSLDENVTNKRQKILLTSPSNLKLKSCKVILQRLSNKEIFNLCRPPKQTTTTKAKRERNYNKNGNSFARKSTQNKEKNYDDNDNTKQIKSNNNKVTNKAQNSLPLQERKNIDCCMTERNCKICVLCDRPFKNLTTHYVNCHKKESYVSRLLWEELDELQLRIPYAELVITKSSTNDTSSQIKNYKIDCPFCPTNLSNIIASFPNLRRHYSKHTGEYAYMCKGCNYKKPFRDEIKEHQENKKCANSGVMELYRYPESTIIYMYLCHICNFVQLNKANVYKHLRDHHHKIKEDPLDVKELKLAAIKINDDDDGLIERIPVNTVPMEMEIEIEGGLGINGDVNTSICVSNEALFDDSGLAGIIKTEPEFNIGLNEEDILNAPSTSSAATATLTNQFNDEDEFVWEKNETTLPATDCEIDLKPDMAFFECLLAEEKTVPKMEIKPDPKIITLESVKARLRKYTSDTGISPDLLYKCSIENCEAHFPRFSLWLSHMRSYHNALLAKCPHCKFSKQTELPLEDFEQHFLIHSIRCYLCFHCDFSCLNENQLNEHFQINHPDILEQRLERISYNMTYTFYIMLEKNLLNDQLEFLMKLDEIYKIRNQQMNEISLKMENLNTTWQINDNPAWLENLQLPIFKSNISTTNCLLKVCNQTFKTQNDLLDHLLEHDIRMDVKLFPCSICNFKTNQGWKFIYEHLFLHTSRIFICCVCSYYNCDRRNLFKHITEQHDQRDVPLIHLQRTEKICKFELEFIFATGMRTFTTTKNCFCNCGTNNLTVDTFITHLRRQHNIKLLYFCEYCNENLPHLQESEEHHKMKHENILKKFKIRCQIVLDKERHIKILTTLPLKIQINDENYDNLKQKIELSSTTSPTSTTPTTLTSSKQNENESGIENISIKKEKDVENENDEIIIMEEDEIVAKDEVKKVQNSNLNNTINRPLIQLKSNLF